MGSWVVRAGLVLTLLLPVVGALAAGWQRGWWLFRALYWGAAVSAAAVAAAVAVRGSARVSLAGPVGLVADPVSVLVLVLVVGVGALVQSFSVPYLQGGPSSGRFAARVGVVVAGMVLVAASADLAGLVAGWVLAGVGFTAVLGSRAELPGVAGCARSVRRALLVGDGCLLGAATVVWVRAGDVRLGSAHSLELAVAHLGGWHPVVAVLVAVAALARCAQGMFRRWLSLTVSAPTPACALLHAGVVNGGGVLLVRLGVIGEWTPAMAGLLVVSGATAVWASLVAARQADVKGQLASSTMAQMGFMLAECAVGAYPAAVVHLVGHGSYKASLFLSSGSPVARRGQAAPAATAGPWWAPVTVGAVTSMVAAAAVVPGVALGEC